MKKEENKGIVKRRKKKNCCYGISLYKDFCTGINFLFATYIINLKPKMTRKKCGRGGGGE
jgi:hypothetical protein